MQGKTILITGASSGIGLASAQMLAKMGFRVFAGHLPHEDISALAHDNITPLPLDITDAAQIAAARDQLAAAVGSEGLYGLFNNAGTSYGGPLEHIPLPVLQKQFEVNAFGHVAMTQACLPLLRQGRGRIVNTVSILGRLSLPFNAPYSMTKFAMEAFSDSLRREVAPFGIKVIVIEPGAIETGIWATNDENRDELWAEIPAAGQDRYRAAMRASQGMAGDSIRRALPPHAVAEVVALAFTLSRPKTRYLIGNDARMLAFLVWLLPDKALDWLLPRVLAG